MCFARDQGYGKGGGVDGGEVQKCERYLAMETAEVGTDGRNGREKKRQRRWRRGGRGGREENRGRGDGGENRLFKLYDRRGQPAKQVLLLESEY